jgi:hypothetical protein
MGMRWDGGEERRETKKGGERERSGKERERRERGL